MLDIALALIGVGATVTGVEDLVAHRRLASLLGYGRHRGAIIGALGALLALLGVAAFVLQTWSPTNSSAHAGAVITGLLVAFLVRSFVMQSNDGADRMFIVVLVLTGVGYASTTGPAWLPLAWSWTVIAIVGIAYFESGLAKVRVKGWREGRTLALVMNVPDLGNENAARFLLDSPRVSFIASWGVIGLELSAGPMFALSNATALLAVMLLGLMHAGIAILMGLGRFFWSFGAALVLVLVARALL
ncbi:hypothetical protein [Agromyces sp. Root81]|uniref:hypothetical protein n=1 Tax=Agromyces sp. Root81 TaxID=1736601 RepID=UPI000AC8B144|nr:hypothetical protein [Agromyces sp. Root81]